MNEASGVDQASRLEMLEFKLAHLERSLQELGDVVYRQQRQLDRALEMNRLLLQQLEQIETRAGDAATVEIPPHY